MRSWTSISILLIAVASLVPFSRGQVEPCTGCLSNTSSQYVSNPCPGGGYGFIKVDVYQGHGVCEMFSAPPFPPVCIITEDCNQFVVAKFGRIDPPLSMVYSSGHHYVTECGANQTLVFDGSCNVHVEALLSCSACTGGSDG